MRSIRSRGGRPRRGFTLIETALATIIVGVGVLAMVQAQTAFHRQNQWSSNATIAERLGNEVREMTLSLPRHDPVTANAYWGVEPNESGLDDYDDLDDFDGVGGGTVFSADLGNGPLNGRREIISGMDGWTQEIRVYNTDPYDITDDAVSDASTETMVVEVVITYQGPNDDSAREMTRVTWVAPN